MPLVNPKSESAFRKLSLAHGLTATHQRQILYEVMCTMPGHPSPEEIYSSVKERVPTVSLATVYKNIHLFVEKGVLKELSHHHGTLRVELNDRPHHHLVCSQCKTVADIDESALGTMPAMDRLPEGFKMDRLSIDVIGICAACQRSVGG